MSPSPFHIGEQRVQTRVGVREAIEPWARQVVRGFMPRQHRDFYSQLPFVVVAARDSAGRPWATLLTGSPGFAQSPSNGVLALSTRPLAGDALDTALTLGTDIGLLGIELETRRRNRVNGTISAVSAVGLSFDVAQSFGNCPQYITEREWYAVDVDPHAAKVTRQDHLDRDIQAQIRSADTMFIASGYRGQGVSESFGMDASHRGGAPGFVKVLGERCLVFPDYAGNNHFNTVGNLMMDARVGLLFVDFEHGGLLQITGTASLDWDSDEVAKHAGAERLVYVDIDEIVRLDDSLPLRWHEPRSSIRSLKVARKIEESEDVMSFELVARDGGELPDFEAGQHLPIDLGNAKPGRSLKRTYSLSNGPGQDHYRISVKRHPNGLVSRLLHDTVQQGDTVNASVPAGSFLLSCSCKPIALISAGIGVTPMLSMLHRLAATDSGQPVLFVHGARDGAHHVFAAEVRQLAEENSNITLDVSYSRPRKKDVLGREYDRRGHVTGDVIAELVPELDAEFYVCGPGRFMADMFEALHRLGVPPDRIHAETFGPSAGHAPTSRRLSSAMGDS